MAARRQLNDQPYWTEHSMGYPRYPHGSVEMQPTGYPMPPAYPMPSASQYPHAMPQAMPTAIAVGLPVATPHLAPHDLPLATPVNGQHQGHPHYC